MWSGVLSLGLYILGLSNWLKLFLIKPLPFYWKHASSIPISRSNTLIYAFIHCFIILIVLCAFACLFIQIFFILVVQSDNICLILIDIYFFNVMWLSLAFETQIYGIQKEWRQRLRKRRAQGYFYKSRHFLRHRNKASKKYIFVYQEVSLTCVYKQMQKL